jgi:hypothetical protein
MKLNKQVESSKSLNRQQLCHLTELSNKISETINDIIKTEELSKEDKVKLQSMDKLSILKIA